MSKLTSNTVNKTVLKQHICNIVIFVGFISNCSVELTRCLLSLRLRSFCVLAQRADTVMILIKIPFLTTSQCECFSNVLVMTEDQHVIGGHKIQLLNRYTTKELADTHLQ